jgi:hypothetical protein
MTTRVLIKNVRFNFTPTLFAAKKGQDANSKEKYSVVGIITRDHPQLAEIVAAMKAAAVNKWGAKAEEMYTMLKAGDKLCLHDGDVKAAYAGYKGNLYLNASNELRPLVIGPDRAPLTAADGKPYSGSYGNMIVDFWAQDNQFGKRINASLMGAQHVSDGERLSGGGIAAADDFEAIPQEAAAAVASAGTGAAVLF